MARLRKIVRHKGDDELWDVVLDDCAGEPGPFDREDEVFRRVISDDRFEELRSGADEGKSFFAPRIKLTRDFWRDLKNAFSKTAMPLTGLGRLIFGRGISASCRTSPCAALLRAMNLGR